MKKQKSTYDPNEQFIEVGLTPFAKENYYRYGVSVLEDRAFPDLRDGLGPIHRRILWSAYALGLSSNKPHVKCARIVGDVIGKYSPHGDASTYKALVGMAKQNQCIAYIDGAGNFGSYTDRAFAAMRYTEARLAKFSDEIFFNKFYTPIMTKVPNFDGKEVEPLVLPALLPTLLLNGAEGIATGAVTYIPSFTYESVIKALKAAYSGEEITEKFLYKTLRATCRLGAVEELPDGKDERIARMAAFKGPKGSLSLVSKAQLDVANREIRLVALANVSQIETFLAKLQTVPGVQFTSSVFPMDISTDKDKFPVISIPLKKADPKEYKKVLARVLKVASNTENIVMNFANRYVDDRGEGQAKVGVFSLTEAFNKWIKWRTLLEKKACQYWIDEQDKLIRRIDLLILAVDNLKLIVQALEDTKKTQDELEEWLAKKLKITKEEAHYIFQLRIIQLRKLEKQTLLKERKEIVNKKAELERRKKKPEPAMLKQLDEFEKLH